MFDHLIISSEGYYSFAVEWVFYKRLVKLFKCFARKMALENLIRLQKDGSFIIQRGLLAFMPMQRSSQLSSLNYHDVIIGSFGLFSK